MKILFTDLDGTLLNTQHQVSVADRQALEQLGKLGIIRVIATGRSYFSLQKVIKPDFPVDFVILSSGAGIMDWPAKTLIQQYEIPPTLVRQIAGFLMTQEIDFMVHAALPDNHWFEYVHPNQHNADFIRRLHLYAPYASVLDDAEALSAASQFVLIFPQEEAFNTEIRSRLNSVNIIRATSPLDHKSVWYELLPKQASKQQAAQFICKRFRIDAGEALAIGNDYNDTGLLDWAGKSFVVANAPKTLRSRYLVTVSQNENPLTEVLKILHLDLIKKQTIDA